MRFFPGNAHQRSGGVMVRQVTRCPLDALFKKSRVGAVIQHEGVMVGLQYHGVGIGQCILHIFGNHPQIGDHGTRQRGLTDLLRQKFLLAVDWFAGCGLNP